MVKLDTSIAAARPGGAAGLVEAMSAEGGKSAILGLQKDGAIRMLPR